MDVAKQILIEELNEDTHVERVSDVIVWALKMYAKKMKGYNGALVASCIVSKIETKEAELNN